MASGLTLTVTSVCFFAFWFYASIGSRLIAPDADERMVRGISRAFRPGTLIYGGATLVALVSPIASVVLFALIAAFYVVESSAFARGA